MPKKERGKHLGILSHPLKRLPPLAVGENSEMADAMKSAGQDMHQEAAHEFSSAEGHTAVFSWAVCVAVGRAIAQGDALAVEVLDAAVADRNSVGVAEQVGEQHPGSGNRRFGIDHPVLLFGVGNQASEMLWLMQW